ncbi:hypothetical protein [Rhabdothermincola salaria]|uniref:hypothetical protein n=1 Tax=Rhabdothermincola salaria TaxID=2903142 RepID=UPI001E3E7726|nr:hypothetical protein [Rhabdothermincola salaria]MCD9625443.1 hypothetical protein [Rhabdothermincola salaria]
MSMPVTHSVRLVRREEALMGPTPDDIDATALLARARAEADAIIGRAEVEAAATRARAQADADALVARARVEAAEAEALARHERERAADLVAEAERQARELTAEAEQVRRSADGTLGRLVAARRELETTIEQLASSPNALVDLTADLDAAAGPADLDAAVDPVDLSPQGGNHGDGRVVPLGGSGRSADAGAPSISEPPMADPRAGGGDPVGRMVRAAVGRAARAAADAPSWPGDPAGQREALRANRRDLG